MDLECEYLLPHDGGRRTGSWTCPGKEECFDYDRTVLEWPDAGCMEVRSPQGVKGAAKTDGHACSAGIAVGSSSITLSSSISANDHNFDNGLKSCQIVKSGTTNSIYKSSPCSKTTTTIKLAPRTTYQACIDVTSALLTTSVGFTWHLHSHRLKGRGLGDGNGKPLSEMLTVLGNSTANDAFQIVIGNGEV
ncbi:hypothetical protein EG327_004923 [Venturia inaequalis]|uniref:Uncharacterized protein n=1 Tax=Venturia inaequalis TaxID=5025 RepID=A0A8H3VVA0_VENIN|nr:hypothetical protein EG327_004923 [Venturia inaequalis]